MGTHPSPQAYERTCVLLLGWDEECDDTETASEVSTHNSQARQHELNWLARIDRESKMTD